MIDGHYHVHWRDLTNTQLVIVFFPCILDDRSHLCLVLDVSWSGRLEDLLSCLVKVPFSGINSSHLFFIMFVNRFPTHDVRGIGQRLDSNSGSSIADFFPIKLIAANF